MLIIIDGHNLIPKIPGLSLRDIDDEEKLLALLQEYARLSRNNVVVFFDGAPPGQAGERAYGKLRAHFVPAGRTADDAIRQYLEGMRKTARGASVVSSDRLVQANARELHARVLTSEDFARQMSDLRNQQAARSAGAPGKGQPQPGAGGGASEVDHWLEAFGVDPAAADKPIELSKKPPRKSQSGRHKPEQPKTTQQKRPRPYHGFPKKS